jgi:hypothetical protein
MWSAHRIPQLHFQLEQIIFKDVSYRKENTTLLHHKDRFVNPGNNHCLPWQSYETRNRSVESYILLKQVAHIYSSRRFKVLISWALWTDPADFCVGILWSHGPVCTHGRLRAETGTRWKYRGTIRKPLNWSFFIEVSEQ